MAFIGAGNQAGNDAREFLKDERLQITTICDVNKRSSGYWNGKVAAREFIMEQVIGHRSITLSHLGNIAMQLKQDLEWDPVNEIFPDNDLANSMLEGQCGNHGIHCIIILWKKTAKDTSQCNTSN